MLDDRLVPFGAQYYRAPTPHPDEWERDLAALRGHGFNTIKIWAQWRWNNPAPGVYDFGDLHTLLDLAAANDLSVVVNVIYDVAPAWLFVEYPDCVMRTNDGRRVEPGVSACRQIGGSPGPSYLHAPSRAVRHGFTEALGRELGGHPALWIWDLWNEPELNGYTYREPEVDTLVDYSPSALSAFNAWLRERYRTVERLNAAWHRNYRGWDEVEVPRRRGTFSDMIDWRMFFVDVMVDELRMRRDAIRVHDATTPVMVHTVPMPYFNAVTCASDEYRLAALCDVFGNSVGSFPFAASVTASAAPDKPVINAEIHALPGSTYTCPPVPDLAAMKRHILVPLARGIKGFLFWQYRPETLGLESPAWGLTDPQGGSTPWLEHASTVNRALQANARLVMNARALPAEVAVVNGTRNQLFDWCAAGTISRHHRSVEGAYMAFHDHGVNADVVSTEFLLERDIDAYRVIYYPFPYYVEEAVAERLAEWVRRGGTLVGEAFFASVRASDGMHSTQVPGLGFDAVFGATEGLRTSGAFGFDQYADLGDEAGGDEAGGDDDAIRFSLDAPIGALPRGTSLRGYRFAEGLLPLTAAAFASFGDGRVAATRASFGAGTAILVGTLLGHAYYDTRDPDLARFIAALAELGGVVPALRCDTPGVRADLLRSESAGLLVVVNNTAKAVDATVDLGTLAGSPSAATDIITGEPAAVRVESGRVVVKASLAAMDSTVYRIDS